MREMARQCASKATRHGLQPSLYLWILMFEGALPGRAASDLSAICLARLSPASSLRSFAGDLMRDHETLLPTLPTMTRFGGEQF